MALRAARKKRLPAALYVTAEAVTYKRTNPTRKPGVCGNPPSILSPFTFGSDHPPDFRLKNSPRVARRPQLVPGSSHQSRKEIGPD